MKFLLFLLFSISVVGISTSVFADEDNQICIDKIWIENTKGKIACVIPSTAASLVERGWGTIIENSENLQVLASMFTVHPEKMKTSAPLPEAAKGPQVDFTKGYLVEEIKDGLYWITDSAYNTMFLTTGEGVIVIDAPPSIGENYLKAITEVTEEPITHVIYSHTHIDHVGSISMFPDDAIYIAHQDAADTLAQRNDPNRPIPTVTFEEKYTLEVGNQKLELDYHGPMHEPGNIFIYAPNQKVLMAVDLIYPGWIPFKDLAMAHDVPAFLASHEKVLEYDFETYVGGHVNRLGTVEDVLIQQEYFEDIQNAATKANQDNSYVEVGLEVGFENPWLVVQIWADAITQQCTDEVVPKWIDRLGGADLFTYDHCWKVSESQRIDMPFNPDVSKSTVSLNENIELLSSGEINLSYSDGKPDTTDLDDINTVLHSVGVHVSTLSLPEEALPILKISQTRALDTDESTNLISIFSLDREDLLEQINIAGRTPTAPQGGFLTTSEDGVPPYPKVYDMKAMTPETITYLQEKFGKLHVNSADDGTGIDEVMTIVSGGQWTWFFVLPDSVIGKLTLGPVGLDEQAWRISYPGIVPHGGFLDAEYGLVVAYAHGPENFVMRYEEPSVMGSELLGTNSWIDYSGETPKLLD